MEEEATMEATAVDMVVTEVRPLLSLLLQRLTSAEILQSHT